MDAYLAAMIWLTLFRLSQILLTDPGSFQCTLLAAEQRAPFFLVTRLALRGADLLRQHSLFCLIEW
jgi:hypothetical protein